MERKTAGQAHEMTARERYEKSYRMARLHTDIVFGVEEAVIKAGIESKKNRNNQLFGFSTWERSYKFWGLYRKAEYNKKHSEIKA